MIKKAASVLLAPVFALLFMGNVALPVSINPMDTEAEVIAKDYSFVIDATRLEQEVDITEEAEEKPSIYHTLTFLDENGEVDFSVAVEHGGTIGYIPDSVWDEGILDYWSHSVTSERLRENTPIYEDATYRPNYIYIEWLIINALDDVGLTLDDIDPETLLDVIEYIKAM